MNVGAKGHVFSACAAMFCALASISEGQAADRIYRCEVEGKVTYSDAGCPAVAEQEEVAIGRLNTYRSDPVTPARSAATTKSKPGAAPSKPRNDSIALEQQRAKQRCDRLDDRLTAIAVKMRAGHSAEQGERLREQQRQIERQRQTEKCR